MGKPPQPLSCLDAAFLYLEAAGTPMHVGSLMLLEVPPRRQPAFLEQLREHVRGRLPRAPVLRRKLLAAGKLPRSAMIAAMPASLREAGNEQADNQVSMVQCTPATDLADPLDRLRAIHASTAQIKQRVAAFKGLIPTDFPGPRCRCTSPAPGFAITIRYPSSPTG